MAKDAESHAADDRKQRDTIEARNRADAMVYNVEKTLKEHRGKVGDAEAKEIEDALEETKKAINENDPDKHQRGRRPADHRQPQAGRGDVQSLVAAGRRRSGRRRPARTAGRGRPDGKKQGQRRRCRVRRRRRQEVSKQRSRGRALEPGPCLAQV